ncbi:malto-oligosyltrehalose trehalohydrolase [Sphingosinicella sp. BN140058]|uniref:malto-oligosyltrehalose trehalohydrolase n=1 Tax=Sphingosinicella sp. BN140058 TaxID=1892855 RepID=UPI00101223B4|nr:malto-oligosyltrehalose trehalohydrolase [Sphingosinicella sp. BN140058]QAY77598.1 malto-oligosyltrehalose trehalohydrolase [Sphingosinicella sp. BN140058]
MTTFVQPKTWGATLRPDGRARFRLWAPGINAVSLEIEGRDPIPMAREAGGWFAIEAPAAPGSAYKYRISTDLAVPDPASRAQAGDVHDASLVVDPTAYTWRVPGWSGRPWEEVVLYELHAGLLGGFRGVAERLPEIAALGVTAIELMPIGDFSGTRNWGYDGVLPYAPDAALGTPDDLKAMVDRAHELGLMVFLDVVYNHFGPEGNYLGAYAADFFRQDVHTPWGGAVDVRQEAVARFFIDNALMWLNEYRFDGLRFDAVHAIGDPEFLDRMAGEIRAAVEPERHVHLVLENESNDAARLRAGGYDAQWNDDFHNVLHVLLTGERDAYYAHFAEWPAERLARCLAEGFVYQGEDFDGHTRGVPSGHLSPTRFVPFLQNHDQIGNRALGERLTLLTDPAKLRAATGLLLLAPQIPLLFMGDEVGSTTPFLFFTDFHDQLADAVREGRRKEFAKFPAFADPEARAKIPDPNARSTFEASRPQPGADAEAWRTLYRELLTLRRERIVPGLAVARSEGAEAIGDKAVVARWRLGTGLLTVALNLGDEAVAVTAPETAPLTTIGAGPVDGQLAGASFVAWLEV